MSTAVSEPTHVDMSAKETTSPPRQKSTRGSKVMSTIVADPAASQKMAQRNMETTVERATYSATMLTKSARRLLVMSNLTETPLVKETEARPTSRATKRKIHSASRPRRGLE